MKEWNGITLLLGDKKAPVREKKNPLQPQSFMQSAERIKIIPRFTIDLFEEVTKSQASGWVVEAEDYKMPPVPMHFYRLVTLDSFFGHCCFLIIFRSVCLQLIGFSEWELLDKYM